jgi:integrase
MCRNVRKPDQSDPSGTRRLKPRATEICDLEGSEVEFGRSASLHVRRAKNGKPSVHPLRGDEIRALRELRRQFPETGFVFATERGGPFTPEAVNRLIKRIDSRAIQDWLGHRSIQHTVRYTELAPTRFKEFWRD